jgi:hypothetical protein
MSGIVEKIQHIEPGVVDSASLAEFTPVRHIPANSNRKKPVEKSVNLKKCYTCVPRGTMKDHIISQSDNFVFSHDIFRRPLIIITSKVHYHTINDIPDTIKLDLFKSIHTFVEFWNLETNYQLMINNGEAQTHHHFHVKMKIKDEVANRMRRDHFNRINLEKTYS